MTVLQISTGFPYSSVYKNMFNELYRQNVDIEVYIPLHNNSGNNSDTYGNYPFRIHSNEIISLSDRLFYFTRIYKMVRDIENKIDLDKTKLIHAHSLFSDGGTAYELKKKYNIPYIVAVRDTDMNKYIKNAKHLIMYARNILINAEKIIFLSDSYREKIVNTFGFSNLTNTINNKAQIIPNGISSYWLENKYYDRPSFNSNKKNMTLLFVGKIEKRKNIKSIIKVSEFIKDSGKYNVKLNVVGEITDIKYFEKLKELGDFQYTKKISKEELLTYYRNADIFIMPSLTETFGLVYAEAMSQALPVIYTKNQGFDQQFSEGTVGYRVSPTNINDIYNKIKLIIDDYDKISDNCLQNINKFNWNEICYIYTTIYKNITA